MPISEKPTGTPVSLLAMNNETWETVIGLEIHAQLSTNSKIFSASPTAYGAPPNAQANLVDLGYPGVLPVLNQAAVSMAVKFGLAIHAAITPLSVFARKNYFYPDLPKGYQISQYELPIVAKGHMDIVLEDGTTKRIGITRAHLEEDAGKSMHEGLGAFSGIDLNRAGTPLIEIVSEPDMRSAKEAVAYLKKIHTLVRYLEICDGNMQEGSFRCDANVSVRRRGAQMYGTRAEIKNINSFRFVEKAIHYEVARQIDILESGGKVLQETRLYDPDKGETRSMRSKEEANDYRYFPDPDLLPVAVDAELIAGIRATLPELPDEKAARFTTAFGLSPYDAGVLTASRELGEADPAGSETRRQLGDGRAGRGAEPRRHRHRREQAEPDPGRRSPAADCRWHHLGEDRQGGLRGHVGEWQRCRLGHRREGPEADLRSRGHREGDR
jgi:aspartyl-tRNA(Asn)/glutamyl-tRNA(Gln) amidotransferase subunit B